MLSDFTRIVRKQSCDKLSGKEEWVLTENALGRPNLPAAVKLETAYRYRRKAGKGFPKEA